MKLKKLASLALAGALTLGLLPAFSSPALAADGDTSYTLTIPSTLTVANSGWNATDGISATGTLATGKKLTVTASSDGEFALVNQNDNTQKVSYKLATASTDTAATTSWEFDTLSSTATTKTMGIIVDDYSSKPAGTYQDTVTFTAKVESAVPAGITLTRNMTFGGDPFKWGSSTDTLSTAFVAGQQVAVFYKNTSGQTAKVLSNALTASDISNEGKSATINVTIDDADKTQPVTYFYPATMTNDDYPSLMAKGSINFNFTAQSGTEASLSTVRNCCKGSGAWDGNALPSVSMASQIAIWKLTMKDDYDDDVDAAEVTVKVGGNTVAYASTTSPYFSPNIVYLALNPATMGTGTLRIEASGLGSTYYIRKSSGVSLTAGKFYQSTLNMSEE